MDKKILIVDDAMFMRSMIRRILKQNGYEDVAEAQDGEQALDLFRRIHPDLVLLDITMPGKSGLEVLEEMIGMDPGAKVIMCSAVGQDTMIQKAVLAWALDFIVKPFKPEEFSKVVNCYLKQ